MGAGEQLDCLGQLRIPGDLAVVVTVGSYDVGEQLGVAGV
jgi:hypothetical protein